MHANFFSAWGWGSTVTPRTRGHRHFAAARLRIYTLTTRSILEEPACRFNIYMQTISGYFTEVIDLARTRGLRDYIWIICRTLMERKMLVVVGAQVLCNIYHASVAMTTVLHRVRKTICSSPVQVDFQKRKEKGSGGRLPKTESCHHECSASGNNYSEYVGIGCHAENPSLTRVQNTKAQFLVGFIVQKLSSLVLEEDGTLLITE